MTACGTDYEVLEDTFEKTLTWDQGPGEIQDCHVFKLDNTRHVEIDRLKVMFPVGSHHVHIYRSSEPQPDKVYDCFNGIDWTKWSLLLGAQYEPMDWQLPEGATIPLEPHQQLLAQVHWLGTPGGSRPSINLEFHTAEESREHLGVLFGVNQRIEVHGGQSVRLEHFCEVPEGAKLHAVMGHFHKFGRDYKLTERRRDEVGGKVLYAAPEEDAFQFQLYQPPHQVKPGAGFEYGCGFHNNTGRTITWGSDTMTQEHCNMTAYYSPANQISKLCLLAPSKLAAVTPLQDSALAGEEYLFEVSLQSPEVEDLAVALRSSNPGALEVPASVIVPKGETSVIFSAHSRRPGHAEVTASVSGASATAQARVGGLVLSEVFYQSATGAAGDLQWVEIANQSEVPLSLEGYSLGAGVDSFLDTKVTLPAQIPARGCVVIGSGHSSPANASPEFDYKADFDPDLGLGGDRAAGIALFASGIASLAPSSRPVDTVVYGGQNSTLRGPDGELAPVWPGAAPGHSLRRLTDTVWTRSGYPTPGNCEVLLAH